MGPAGQPDLSGKNFDSERMGMEKNGKEEECLQPGRRTRLQREMRERFFRGRTG